MSKRMGTPITVPLKETSLEDLGMNWEISEETIKEIQNIEDQQRIALAHFWHWYV